MLHTNARVLQMLHLYQFRCNLIDITHRIILFNTFTCLSAMKYVHIFIVIWVDDDDDDGARTIKRGFVSEMKCVFKIFRAKL